MKNLISSISYGKKLYNLLLLKEITYKQYVNLRTEYDTFLESAPQLNHFVPAVLKDGNWRVLENPNENNTYNFTFAYLKEKYETALKDVIFDGWRLDFQITEMIGLIKDDYQIWFYKSGFITINSSAIRSYSDLTKYNLPLNEKGCEKFKL